jgi:hypothetical protein
MWNVYFRSIGGEVESMSRYCFIVPATTFDVVFLQKPEGPQQYREP